MNKQQHEKFLRRYGASRDQIKKAKKKLGSPYSIPDYKLREIIPQLSNTIPENGTKESDTTKADFCKKNYPMMPAYNKGPVMVVSKDEVKYAGKKM